MTRLRAGHFETLASTDAGALQADQIQYDVGSGPCVDAILAHTVFRTGDLRTDPRWPEFGRRAFEETGMLSMLSIRLFLEDDSDMLVGINMYSRKLEAFDDEAEASGVLLATHASLAVAGVRAREQNLNLHIALENRTDIGIAIGILMTQHKITRDDAFNLLRLSSQHTHRKLHDVATEVADTGVLPVPPRRGHHLVDGNS